MIARVNQRLSNIQEAESIVQGLIQNSEDAKMKEDLAIQNQNADIVRAGKQAFLDRQEREQREEDISKAFIEADETLKRRFLAMESSRDANAVKTRNWYLTENHEKARRLQEHFEKRDNLKKIQSDFEESSRVSRDSAIIFENQRIAAAPYVPPQKTTIIIEPQEEEVWVPIIEVGPVRPQDLQTSLSEDFIKGFSEDLNDQENIFENELSNAPSKKGFLKGTLTFLFRGLIKSAVWLWDAIPF